MKKLNFLFALILAFSLVGAGCSTDEVQDEEQVTANVENDMEETDEEASEETEDKEEDSEKSLDNIFSQTQNMENYSYEIYTDLADGTSFVTKLWSSGNKSKMESNYPETGENVTMIIDGDEEVSYLYMPAENMALKIPYDNFAGFAEGEEEGTEDYIELMKGFADDEEVEVEDGTYEGEPVKIITGEIDGNTNIIWVSTQTGFPLKSEFYMDGELESTATFENFDDSAIDPSIFNLPEDVEIQDMTNFQ